VRDRPIGGRRAYVWDTATLGQAVEGGNAIGHFFKKKRRNIIAYFSAFRFDSVDD